MGERSQSKPAGSRAWAAASATGAEGESGGLDALATEIRALRQEIRDLRVLVLQLASAPASPAAAAPGAGPGPTTSQPANPLARRQAEQLASAVQQRQALGGDPEQDTELDLLIDRLHDLALEAQP